jgi:hypothetical protein
MGTRLRLTILVLTRILGDFPPASPPGASGYSEAGECPNCGCNNTTEVAGQVFCRDCQAWFPREPVEPETS